MTDDKKAPEPERCKHDVHGRDCVECFPSAPEPSGDDVEWAQWYAINAIALCNTGAGPFEHALTGRQSLRAELDRVTAALARTEKGLAEVRRLLNTDGYAYYLVRTTIDDIAKLKGKA